MTKVVTVLRLLNEATLTGWRAIVMIEALY